jgi:hypothetical protein
MKKRLLIVALITFIFGLIAIAGANAGDAGNPSLTTLGDMALLDLFGIFLWFMTFIFLILGLVLKN